MILKFAVMTVTSVLLGNLLSMLGRHCGTPEWLRIFAIVLMGFIIGLNPPIK